MRCLEAESFKDWIAFERGSSGGFAEEKVDVLGHDDVAEDFESIALAGEFKGVEEGVSCGWGVEVGFSVVAAKGDEVVVALSLITLEVEGHGFDFRV